jgi:hypothetical protein
MSFLSRKLFASPAPAQRRRAVVCPECGSPLVQPQGWKELPHGVVLLHFRCPECQVRSSDTFEQRVVEEYDQTLLEARKAITAGYERIVRQNMTDFAAGFIAALERDLIDADDFGTVQPARCSAR